MGFFYFSELLFLDNTTGVYDIKLIAMDDLGNSSEYVFELTVEKFLGIDEITLDFASVTLYPNPVTDHIILSNPNSLELQDVTIYDLTGRLIKTINLVGMGAEKSIDVSELASAPYLFIIQGETGKKTTQIIKK